MPEEAQIVRAAVAQMNCGEDVEANLSVAADLVAEAAAAGAALVGLPENFAYLGAEAQKVELAETLGEGPISQQLAGWAKQHDITIIAGGMPETSDDPKRAYNTCVVVTPGGEVAASYRKIHLFDFGSLQESRTVLPGDEPVVAELEWGKLGLSVCYDLRFPELYRALVDAGAQVLAIPSAFTLHTGKDHWEVLVRSRAIENQAYVVAPAQTGRHSEKRSSWGKAMIVDPWGAVTANAGERVGIAIADLNLTYVKEVRRRLPALQHRRL